MSKFVRARSPALHRRGLLRLHRASPPLVPHLRHPDRASPSLALLIRGLALGHRVQGRRRLPGHTVTVNAAERRPDADRDRGSGVPDLDDPTSTRSATTRSGCRPAPWTRPNEVPKVRAAIAKRGRHQHRPGRLQPDRRVLGRPDHRAGADRARGVPGPGHAGDLGLLPERQDVARPRWSRCCTTWC